MRNHLVTDTDCNTLNLQTPRKLQEMTNNVGFKFSVGDTRPWFTISIEQDN